MLPELPAGFGGIGSGEDGGDGAEARCSGAEDFAYVAQVDSSYGKPGYRDIRRRPTHIIQSHGRYARLGCGGVNGADGNVGRAGGQCAERLRGRMCAQAQQRKVRRCARREKLRGIGPACAEEIFLPQMAKVSADFAGDVPVIVYDQADTGAMEHGQDFFGQAAYLVGRCAFGAELD